MEIGNSRKYWHLVKPRKFLSYCSVSYTLLFYSMSTFIHPYVKTSFILVQQVKVNWLPLSQNTSFKNELLKKLNSKIHFYSCRWSCVYVVYICVYNPYSHVCIWIYLYMCCVCINLNKLIGCPYYCINDVLKQTGQPNTTTRASLPKLNQPLRRTNHCQNNVSHIVPITWNNLANFQKTIDNLNTYKHKVKEHFFHRIRNQASNICSYF